MREFLPFSDFKRRLVGINNQDYHPFISVVIPTYNRCDRLRSCLASLENQGIGLDRFELIVVNDGSTDSTPDFLMSLLDTTKMELRTIHQENRGPAAARNRGIDRAKGSIVAFTDDDCIAHSEWLKRGILPFARDDSIVGVEGRIDCPRTPINDRELFLHDVENTNGGLYATANMFYRREALLKVGGFNEAFPMPYREDIDLALRMQQLGSIVFEPSAQVQHPEYSLSYIDLIKRTRVLLCDAHLARSQREFCSVFLGFDSALGAYSKRMMTIFFNERERRMVKQRPWLLARLLVLRLLEKYCYSLILIAHPQLFSENPQTR